jgi:hypothetical protein
MMAIEPVSTSGTSQASPVGGRSTAAAADVRVIPGTV